MSNKKVTIVGIQFKGGGKIYYFDPLKWQFNVSDMVVVETVRGLELGKIIIANREIEESNLEYELKPIVRKATKEDIINEEKNNLLAVSSFETFKKYVKQLDLDMKPLYCEYTIDSSKIIFYYCSEERVDFRELLKLLAPEFKIRVELRQIGAREAARVLGGIGSCGQVICCKKYLQNFDFVTMKMAKEQSMSLNNNKISGVCGKLMCCIAYENELYKELKKELPAVGNLVETPTCPSCKVVAVDYLKKTVKTDENPNGTPVVHKACDVRLLNFARSIEEPEVIVTAEEITEEEIEITEEVLVEEESTETFSDESQNASRAKEDSQKNQPEKNKKYKKKKYRYGKKK